MERDGEYHEIYREELTEGEQDYIALYFGTEILGLYDLDGDGKMELCYETMHWDVPEVFVCTLTGQPETVLETGFAW